MKREFGKALIQRFFHQRAELSHVIDTSGVFIPGHGTPTVILVGRNRVPSDSRKVRAVLGVRGEPSEPKVAAEGKVWQSILNLVHRPGSGSEWVTVEDLPRSRLADFPWSLSGGGAGDVVQALVRGSGRPLAELVESIGFCAVTREDDAYMVGRGFGRRSRISDQYIRPLLGGSEVREWGLGSGVESIFPYSSVRKVAEIDAAAERVLWKCRTPLKLRRALSGTQEEQGLEWFEYSSFSPRRYWADLLISFAFVSTHNHFSLRRADEAFIRTAPVIKLPDGAGEDDHLELLGVLNSSTACFWLKQVSQGKGGSGLGRGLQDEEWEERYEFTGTKLQEFPLPAKLPLYLGRALDARAQKLLKLEPSVVCIKGVPERQTLVAAKADHSKIRRRMIALQEELDWQVYGLYGLLNNAETARTVVPSSDPDTIPEVKLGERAFEIVLARKAEAGELDTAWFTRHNSTPVTEVPTHWPDWYRNIVQARIDLITSRKDIALIERPECKRRWAADSWEKKERTALRNWLLDRCEDSDLWFEVRDGLRRPRTLTINNLADRLGSDPDFTSVAALYASEHLKKPDLPLAQVLNEVIADEHVPYLASMRYKDSGLRTRREWEKVWDKQREEDRTGSRLDIDPPTKYKSSDFLRPSYWTHRGKLDVPKERFISYPEAGPDSDSTLMLGWAGWDHKDQAVAITQLIDMRVRNDAWGADRLVPMLAGLREAMPWVQQWYSAYDDEWEGSPAEDLEAEYRRLLRTHAVSEVQMKDWRPVRKTRGRNAAQSSKQTEQPALDDE